MKIRSYLSIVKCPPRRHLLVIWGILYSCSLISKNDTLYICKPGDAVQLHADTAYVGFRWSPVNSLSNPTLPDPFAMPTTTTTYYVESISASGPNRIVNNDFSLGNQGFSSQYTFSPGANPTQGVYGIFSDANNLSPQYFSHCRDHTDGQGHLMVVDGSPQPNQEVWCQTVPVEPNTIYGFSTWVTPIYPPNPARLQFSINGIALAEPFNAGSELCEWRQFYTTWASGPSTEAQICIVNQNTDPNGNDFALDDFSFFKLGEFVYDTVTVVVENLDMTIRDTSICAGGFVEYNGISVPADTSIIVYFTSEHGCDSLVRLNVNVLDTVYQHILIDTLCPGDRLEFFGHIITRDTFICETFAISSTCDSSYCLTAIFLTETALETEVIEPSCAGYQNGQIKVTINAGLKPFIYQWNNGSNLPLIEHVGSGMYALQVTDSRGCSASKQVQLFEPLPLMPQVMGRSKLCNGEINGTLDLEASGGTGSYLYSLDDGLSFQSEMILQHLDIGDYSIIVEDENGCMATQDVTIPPPESIDLFAPNMVQISLGTSVPVQINTNTAQALTFEWIPADGVECPICAQTTVKPLRKTTYAIIATDTSGCKWNTHWTVDVFKEPDVFIPNAFSPNGDGLNDYFTVFGGPSVARFVNLKLFDRWGNLFFEMDDCQSEEGCRWDGLVDGQLSGSGIYVFTVTVEYIDGDRDKLTKDVLLIR